MEAFEDIVLSDIVPMIILGAVENAKELKTSRTTGLSGGEYLYELLNCNNDKRIYKVLRMKSDTFDRLCLWPRKNGGLINGRKVLIKEQVAIFLWIIKFDASIEETAEQFQHSSETISR